jgi:hypothetical protein
VGNLLVGAIIGFASAFLLRSWQYRRDVWLKRVEGLCAVLDLAAQSGTEYWIAGRAEQGNGVHKDSSSEAKSDQTEARIIGLQGRVDGMFASLELDETNDEDLQRLLSDFRDSLTGGCFGGATRDSDPDRARLVQMYASDLIVAVWGIRLFSPLLFVFDAPKGTRRNVGLQLAGRKAVSLAIRPEVEGVRDSVASAH